MCKVLNIRCDAIPPGAVYIGRGSKWGNPFRIGPDGSRDDVIRKHEARLHNQHRLLRALDELRDCDLVCYCAPLRCHGQLLHRLGNATREERIAWWRAGRWPPTHPAQGQEHTVLGPSHRRASHEESHRDENARLLTF